MKKTLVALAALAATGAFAQVTITGQLAMGYLQSTSPAGDAGGLGVDTSQIDFAATEDLGAGWKATAKMSLAGADRSGESGNGTVNGRNATLALSTPVGVVTLGSVKASDYLSGGVAGVGAVWYGMDDLVFSSRVKRDTLTYAVPVGAFSLSASHQEGANTQGLGSGAQGTQVQRLNAYGVNYSAGALVVDAAVLQFDQAQTGGDAAAKDEQRLSGSYDLGVAKLGAGVQITNYQSGAKKTQTLLGAAIPLGNLSLGAQWAQRKSDDYTTGAAAVGGNGTRTGYSLAAVYSLSKRTSVAAQYSSFDASVNPSARSTVTGVLLSHTF